MIDYNKLSSLQLDALKEVANIGAAHAATALSQIISKTVMISVSQFEIIPVLDIFKVMGGKETEIAVVYMRILGDVNGGILLCFKKEDALFFLNDIFKLGCPGTAVQLDNLNEMKQSALKELGGILTFSYLSAMGKFLELSLIPSVPDLACGEAGGVLEKILLEISKRFEVAFCIETEFIESTNKIKGFFLLIPEAPSLMLILKALGFAN